MEKEVASITEEANNNTDIIIEYLKIIVERLGEILDASKKRP